MSELLEQLKDARSLWIRGRAGGGKTLLSVVLAYELVVQGFVSRVVANVPLFLPGLSSTPLGKGADAAAVADAVILLDEAGHEIGTDSNLRKVREWVSFPRKNNQILLFPSLWPVHKELRRFYIQRMFCGTKLGLPLWVYRWSLDVGERKRLEARLALWTPSHYYGLYDTFSKPVGWSIYE